MFNGLASKSIENLLVKIWREKLFRLAILLAFSTRRCVELFGGAITCDFSLADHQCQQTGKAIRETII